MAARNGSPARKVIARMTPDHVAPPPSAALLLSAAALFLSTPPRAAAHHISSGSQANVVKLFCTSSIDSTGPLSISAIAPPAAARCDALRRKSRYAPAPRRSEWTKRYATYAVANGRITNSHAGG